MFSQRKITVPEHKSVTPGTMPFSGKSITRRSVQPKLKLGPTEDKHEKEADSMAEKVLAMDPSASQGERSRAPGITARGNDGNDHASSVDTGTQDKINSMQGGGSPMDRNALSLMSGRFGADFSRVRIHTGEEAAALNEDLNARAFAIGKDIFFNQGEYQPGTMQGNRLLAHELTHVVQQNTGVIRRAPKEQAKAANWWDDKSIGMKPNKLFWDDIHLFFPKDGRKFSGSGYGNVTNIDCDDRGMVTIGKAYWEEADPMKRKAWLIPMIEKLDNARYDQARIDNEDLTNTKIVDKLKALSGTGLQKYIAKLKEWSKYIANDQVIAFLEADDKGKTTIINTENEKLLDWKFDENRLTDADLKDEKTSTRLRGLSTADKLSKETKAKEFGEKTGEQTSKLQTFLHTQTQTSTPVPDEATVDSAGGFTMSFPNVDVIVLPDTSGGKGNETSINTNLPNGSFNYSMTADGVITEFYRGSGKSKVPLKFPSKLVITIQTSYQDISKVDEQSAYGKGTTAQDVKWGATTLRFHEGSHGKQYIDYIRSHSWPDIALGTVKGDDIKTITDQMKEISNESCQTVDQVGTTQDQFLQTDAGKKSGIVSCNK